LLNVLVVDRESDMRGLFETILMGMGHHVKTQKFLDADEADGERYDLIILDLASFEPCHMPLLDAYTYGKLCASSIWKESNLPPDVSIEYDYYLQKPFLIDSLRKILDSVKLPSPSPGS
jgi:DNA-binding NtrC family response regulator